MSTVHYRELILISRTDAETIQQLATAQPYEESV